MTLAKQTVLKSFAAVVHDHGRCVTTAMAKAETACATAGKRLTPLRRRVLELVWGSHLPVKAYDLLAILGREREQAAFVGCGEPLQGHVSQFLICTQCGTVAELANLSVSASISASAEALGFQATRQTIEVEGTCKHCSRRGAQTHP